MRIIFLLISFLTLILGSGCRKNDLAPNCGSRQTSGVITQIAAPDSIRVGEPQTLTLSVSAPDLCVTKVEVNVVRVNDTLYNLEPVVYYNEVNGTGCECSVEQQHFVRVYFSAVESGYILLSTGTGFNPAPGHRIKVY